MLIHLILISNLWTEYQHWYFPIVQQRQLQQTEFGHLSKVTQLTNDIRWILNTGIWLRIPCSWLPHFIAQVIIKQLWYIDITKISVYWEDREEEECECMVRSSEEKECWNLIFQEGSQQMMPQIGGKRSNLVLRELNNNTKIIS